MAILRPPEATKLTGLSQSTLRRMVERGDFPPPLRLGLRSIGWWEEEVLDWLKSRPRASSDNNPPE